MPTSLNTSTRDIIILGASGNCLDILDCILDSGHSAPQSHNCAPSSDPSFRPNSHLACTGFLDDNAALWQHKVQGLPVLGALHSARNYAHAFFVNGIGNSRHYLHKEAIIRSTQLPDARFIAVISPWAQVARSASIGQGTVVLSHSCVASQAVLKTHVMVLQHCIINHNSIIEDFATLAANVTLAGGCRIGRGAYIGSSACLREGVQIGDYAMVGMGAVVTKDVPARTTVVGNPATIFRT